MDNIVKSRDTVNQWLERFGVRFGVYKNGIFNEQLFPFDSIPRVISKTDWDLLERGLKQRVKALNKFLYDIYHDGEILKDGIVPEDFVYAAKDYMPECRGINPPRGIYAHIAGIDLVQGKDDKWYILEDNLRIPSGASYPMIARTITRRVSPETFSSSSVADNRDYPELLRHMMDYVNEGRGINVVLTPGRYNSAFFEHSYLAEKTGSVLAFPGDLMVDDGCVWYTGLFDERKRVGTIYRRVSDEYIDPMAFEPSSLLGVPNLLEACRRGTVALVNALGNGAADDKGIYYFVPKMIEYYLNEKPLLSNAPTYLPYYKEDFDYIMAHLGEMVIKDVSEAGGYGVVFGRSLPPDELEQLRCHIFNEPRRFIAQEVIDFKDLPIIEGSEKVERKADLRAFVITAEDTVVWKSGLTRFSRNPNSFVVNSSQGGGFKDTWVMNN